MPHEIVFAAQSIQHLHLKKINDFLFVNGQWSVTKR